MTNSAFDLGEEIKLRTVEYKLHPDLWNNFNCPNLNLNYNQWTTSKYLNENADGFDTNIDNIPADKGGLYMFYVKCGVIPGLTEYPLYIGRAQYTEHQNLKKRVKEYFQKFAKNNERPLITKMFTYWAKELYIAYIILEENDEIKDIEKQIINSLLLPMNSVIPDIIISQAINAF